MEIFIPLASVSLSSSSTPVVAGVAFLHKKTATLQSLYQPMICRDIAHLYVYFLPYLSINK
jgi:hypothetical protein